MANDTETIGVLGQYKILMSSPVQRHGGSSAEAYWAQQNTPAMFQGSGQASASSLVALVGDRTSFFRTNMVDRYRSVSSPYLMRLLDWGVVDWTGGDQRLAMIFHRPAGPSLYDSAIAGSDQLSEADIIGQILPPLVKVMKELAEHRLMHCALRPENIYRANDGTPILGECLSGPPNFDQSVAFLTIERGLAMPLGRGAGTPADDIYALGATLVSLAAGAPLLSDLDAHDIVRQKMERGSMTALVGRHHLGSALMELARGMLDDNPQQRWTIDVVEQWMNGRRSMGAQALSARQASRPMVVQGVEYWDPRLIADAFAHNIPEAMRLIENDELIKWVRRALRDIELAERIADAVNMPLMVGKFGSYDNRLVARIIMALHPAGPIRYQGYALMPDAFGDVLAKVLISGESPQPLAEMIVAQLPLYWYNIQPSFHEDHVSPIKSFEFARTMIEQSAMGGGIERCHYELSPNSAYIAEGFEKMLIRDSRQFILALEVLAGQTKRPASPVTRQAAAFLAARDSKLGNRVFSPLIKAITESERALGSLQILSTVQRNTQVEKLPHLAMWFETLLQPAIERLHNRSSRETMRNELRKVSLTGNLSLMLATIENQTFYQMDREGLARAKRDYNFLEIEKSILLEELMPHARVHLAAGREAATIVAGILSIVFVVTMVALQVGPKL